MAHQQSTNLLIIQPSEMTVSKGSTGSKPTDLLETNQHEYNYSFLKKTVPPTRTQNIYTIKIVKLFGFSVAYSPTHFQRIFQLSQLPLLKELSESLSVLYTRNLDQESGNRTARILIHVVPTYTIYLIVSSILLVPQTKFYTTSIHTDINLLFPNIIWMQF